MSADEDAPDTLPLFTDTPDVVPGRIAVELPPRRVHTFARPKGATDDQRANVTRIRAGVPVLVAWHELGEHQGAAGIWSTICRGERPGYWVLVPDNDAARSWATERDVAQIDAHAWSLIPLRHVS